MRVSVLLILMLSIVWLLVTGAISLEQWLIGLLVSSIIVLTAGLGRGHSIPVAELPPRLAMFVLFVLILVPYDVLRANFKMARRLMHLKPDTNPGIVGLPAGELTQTAHGVEELSITLTPGQIVVDYTADENTIYVHFIDVDELESEKGRVFRTYRILQEVFK